MKWFFWSVAVISLVSVVAWLFIERAPAYRFSPPYLDRSSIRGTNENVVAFEKENKALFRVDNSIQPLCLSKNLSVQSVPTNKIWSSVVFGCEISGLHAMPLSIQQKKEKLMIGFPQVKAFPQFVTNVFEEKAIELTFAKPYAKASVSAYTDLSVDIDLVSADDQILCTMRVVQGSPYIAFHHCSSAVTIQSSWLAIVDKGGEKTIFQDKNSTGQLAVIPLGDTIPVRTASAASLSQNEGFYDWVLAYAPTQESSQQIYDLAKNTLQGVAAVIDPSTSTLNYQFEYTDKVPAKKTVFGLLPHHVLALSNTPIIATTETIRGSQKFVIADSSLATKIPIPSSPVVQPSLVVLSPAQKLVLQKQVSDDLLQTPTIPKTSYFGAKQLARVARLLEIARDQGFVEEEAAAKKLLKDNLTPWLQYDTERSSQFFSYNSTLGGLVAQTAEFDSDKFNDHHFHYGYFVYAASVLAEVDPAFLTLAKPTVDLIVADIAMVDRSRTDFFPYIRTFDLYEQHSWASGYGQFADGNNQESTSEAINAWYGVQRWADISGQKSLSGYAGMLKNMEINSTKLYWFDTAKNIFKAPFARPMASLVWGNKYDFATWFSGATVDIAGIQALPITNVSTYLDSVTLGKDFTDTLLSDISSSKGSLVDVALALVLSQKVDVDVPQLLTTIAIDNGNSKSNLLVWYWYQQNR